MLKRAEGVEEIENSEHSKNTGLLAGSLHPAKLLGLEHKGRLSQGADADLVLLDDTLHVRGCFVGGQLAWAHASLHGALWWHR